MRPCPHRATWVPASRACLEAIMLGREKEGAERAEARRGHHPHHHEEALRGAQAAALPGCATTACRSGPGLSSGHPFG